MIVGARQSVGVALALGLMVIVALKVHAWSELSRLEVAVLLAEAILGTLLLLTRSHWLVGLATSLLGCSFVVWTLIADGSRAECNCLGGGETSQATRLLIAAAIALAGAFVASHGPMRPTVDRP